MGPKTRGRRGAKASRSEKSIAGRGNSPEGPKGWGGAVCGCGSGWKWKEMPREIQARTPWGRPVGCGGPGSQGGGMEETPTC